MFQKAGMLSPEGRCKTLDAAADGYVRAEACGVTMLAAWSTDEPTLDPCRSAMLLLLSVMMIMLCIGPSGPAWISEC